MIKNLYAQKIFKTFKTIQNWISVLGIIIFIHSNSFSQITVSTSGFANNNISLAVVFNFQNTNNYDVMITEIASIPGITGVQTATAWFIASPTTGTPSGISTLNGWTMIGQNTNFNGVANTTTSTPLQTMITGMSLIVPANTTYRMALELSSSLRYSSIPAGVYTFPNGGCNIITGTDIGYGGSPASPVNTPRGFIGSVTFIPILPCSGTPNPGNTISNLPTACAGGNFNLTISNTLVANQSYQWQSAPSSNGPWTNITGATNISRTQSHNQGTWYRNMVTCNSTGLSAPSNPVFVDRFLNVSCYCASSAIASSNEDISNVTFGTLNNSSTCSTTGGNSNGINSVQSMYSNYTNLAPPTVSKGEQVSASVSITTCGTNGGNMFKVYIDYNQNGSFADAGEEAYVSTIYIGAATQNFNVTIPVTALSGTTQMRIVSVRTTNAATINPCGTYNFGETEDYLIFIDNQVVCSGTPNPGTTISSAANVCSGTSFNLSLQNQTTGTGVTYQWQSADNAAFTVGVQNIGTASALTTSQTTPKYYRCIVTCNGNSGTSTPVLVQMSSFINCYCSAAANSTSYEKISNFSFGSINNSSSSTSGYENFTNITSNISAGSGVPVSITISNPYATDDRVYVWVDINQNGVFENPGELFYQGTVSSVCPSCNGSGSVTLNGTITLPVSSLSGLTGLRVRLQDNSFGGNSTPCGNSEYGQVEDYRVNITVPVLCSGTPNAGSAQISSNQSCAGNSITATLTGNTADFGTSLQWESSFNGGGYSNISGATNNQFTSGALSVGNYQYRCKVTCSYSGLSSYSNVVSVSVSNTPAGNFMNNPIAVGFPYYGSGNNLSSNCWTNTGGEPSPDVYYSVTTGNCANLLNVSLCGAGTLTDSYISILDVNGNVLATNDDDGPYCASMQASISLIISPSTTYLIRVEGYSNTMGTYSIYIDQESTPTTLFYADNDGDGYGNPNQSINVCYVPSGYVSNALDCNDSNPNVNPSKSEICANLIDDNCNGQIDEGVSTQYFTDNDNDGFGSALIGTFCSPPKTCNGTYSLRLFSNTWGDESGYIVRDAANQIVAQGFNLGGSFFDYEIPLNLSNGPFTVQLYTICVFGDNQPNFEFKFNGAVLGSGSASGCNGLTNVSGMCSGTTYGVTLGGDCNDNNFNIKPGAIEICNGIDDNCNGQIDEGLMVIYYADNDGDGYGNPNVSTSTCSNPPAGYVANHLDCNDNNPMINPGAVEICNSIDDNCDGIIDNGLTFITYYQDLDADGYGNPNVSISACSSAPAGYVNNNFDCNDNNANINPSVGEICNGLDDNCDGIAENGLNFVTYFADVDGDGFGDLNNTIYMCDVPPPGYVTNSDDCNDLFWTYTDNDEDGYGSSAYNVACGISYDNSDCDDYNSSVNPGSGDWCENGVDDNCNGIVDEYCTTIVPTYCDVIYTNYNTLIYANPVSGATNYMFRLYNIPTWQTNNFFYLEEIEKSTPSFSLNDFPSLPANTTYLLEVAAKVNGVYGQFSISGCSITTQYEPITLAANSCGATLESLNSFVFSTIVPGASWYRFKINNGFNEQIIEGPNDAFTFNQVNFVTYGQTYQVRVSYVINGVDVAYGAACNVTTPNFPIPSISPTLCGTQLAFINNPLMAITGNVGFFEGVRFRITGPSGQTTIDVPGVTFSFLQVPGYQFATTYTVEAAVKSLGIVGPYGPPCTVTTPNILTQIQPSQCGVTLAAINTSISANQVSFATQYRFKITANGLEQFITQASRTFNLTQLANYWYSTSYFIEVQAEVNGVWGPYGQSCLVVTPQIPTTQIQASQCGVNLLNSEESIFANFVMGASNYRFKIVWGNNELIINRPERWFRFSQHVPGFIFGSTYSITVAPQVGGILGQYGPVCNVSFPIPTTQVQSSQCGNIISSADEVVFANLIPNSSAYRFRVVWGQNTVIFDRPERWFRFTQNIPGFTMGTTYQISVAVQYMGVWGNYGQVCQVTVPIPTSQIQPSQCGITISSTSESVFASIVSAATKYRFRLQSLNSTIVITRPERWFRFNQHVPGFNLGTTYQIDVAVETNGTWGPYGPVCNVTTPLTPSANPNNSNSSNQSEEEEDVTIPLDNSTTEFFDANAFPNPFTNSFNIQTSSSSLELVSFQLLDMNGRVIMIKKHLDSNQNFNIPTESLNTGIYILKITQGDNLKVIKMIKSVH